MINRIRTKAKDALLKAVSLATSRHAVLLPREAANEALIFPVTSDYRADSHVLRLQLREAAPGQLRVTILGYHNGWPTRVLARTPPLAYSGPRLLEFDLTSRELRLASVVVGRADELPSRRFVVRFEWTGADGQRRDRSTGHYVPSANDTVDESYFRGQTYVDYEQQSAGDYPVATELLARYGVTGPVLEVGCATGGLLAAMQDAGIEGYGVDKSAWAVQEATQHLGGGRVWACNVETDPLPSELAAKGPFTALVLWAVYEHFRDPVDVLKKLSGIARPGALLIINTTNADSLSRRLFHGQWEGHFDPTHFGVEQVSAASLRRDLPALGWRVLLLETRLVWDACSDPSHATIRDWHEHDARFRELLAAQDLGDFIHCVAIKG